MKYSRSPSWKIFRSQSVIDSTPGHSKTFIKSSEYSIEKNSWTHAKIRKAKGVYKFASSKAAILHLKAIENKHLDYSKLVKTANEKDKQVLVTRLTRLKATLMIERTANRSTFFGVDIPPRARRILFEKMHFFLFGLGLITHQDVLIEFPSTFY